MIFVERDYTLLYGIYFVLNIILIGILLAAVSPMEIIDPPKPPVSEPYGPIPEGATFIKGDDLILSHTYFGDFDGILLPPPIPPEQPEPPKKEPKPTQPTKPTQPSKPTEPVEPKEPEPSNPAAKIIYSGGTSKKQVAITFDDGPDPGTLDTMLNILDQYNAKATFFLLGQRAKNSQNLVQKIYDRGHQVANHSNSHPQFSTLSWNEAVREITETEKILGNYQSNKYFRPPYGNYKRETLEVAYHLDYRVIYWDVDTRDWAATNHNQIINVVKQKTKPGSIILFHEGKKLTIKALPEVLEWLTNQGYEFVTVAELLGE